MKRVIVVFVVLVAALSAVLYVELGAQQRIATRASQGSGTIEGVEVDVVARLMARIGAVHVAEGDRVVAGQLLVDLDCAEPEAALAHATATAAAARAGVDAARVQVALAEHAVTAAGVQAEAALAAAAATRSQRGPVDVQRRAATRAAERLAALGDEGGASAQDLDRARTEAAALTRQLRTVGAGATAAERQADAVATQIGAARLRVDLAAAQLVAAERQAVAAEAAVARARTAAAECRLVAPRAGVVSLRSYEPGEVVMPGARVLTLVDIAEVRATLYLPNAELAAAAPGREVRVTADAMPERTFTGRVTRVAASAEFTPRNVQTRDDRDRLVYAVEVAIANGDEALRPGMPVEIVLPGTERGAP